MLLALAAALLGAWAGCADLEAQAASTPETRFLMGSATKAFTAIAVLQRAQAGRIDLNAPLSEFLRDYPAAVGRRVTLHHLLSHTSGLPDLLRVPEFVQRLPDPITPEELVVFFQDEPLCFEPGTAYAYTNTNTNYVLQGLVIEAVTGRAWEAIISENI